MHTCIPSHGPKRSWHSYPRRVNAGNKNTPSMQHASSTKTEYDYLNGCIKKKQKKTKTVTYEEISPKHSEPQRSSWGRRRRRTTMSSPSSSPCLAVFVYFASCALVLRFPCYMMHNGLQKLSWISYNKVIITVISITLIPRRFIVPCAI